MAKEALNRWQTWDLICSLGTNPHPGLMHPLDKKIIALYQEGMSIEQVAYKLNEGRHLVNARLILHGKSRGKWTGLQLDEDEIIRRYTSGETMESIARSMGCTATTIKNRLAKRGVQLRKKSDPDGKHLHGKELEAHDGEILELYQQGMSTILVGEKLGLSHNFVYRRLRALGANRSRKEASHGAPKRLVLDEDEIIRRYKAGETLVGIGEAMGVSNDTIKRRLLKNQVELRTSKDAVKL
mgnify:CR=1 FL=1